ncbi:MAG: NAD(+) synthase [Mycoplasmoidaceae bacterium]|nr:NAD(+) synthase [Mycoplasmoidaceae bacterium]
MKCLEKSSCQGYVVGVSGGIDSAVTIAILSKIPNIRLVGAFIDIESNQMDKDDAKSLTKIFDFEYQYINLTEEYRLLVKKLGIEKSDSAKANLKARLRTITLYALANANNLLTCGTTNAAERLVGYYTKFGDNACDVQLLCYLTKSHIRYLADYFKVPTDIISKHPSAGLFEGQTDEQDMEITYQEIDHYLSFAVIDQIQDQKITTRYVANKHKLNAPVRPKKFICLRNTK